MARDPIEDTNTMLVASDAALSARRLRARARLAAAGAEARARATRPRASSGPLPGGSVYTDDRAPVEWLVDESIVHYAAGD